jgi:hypothetical protein
MTIAGIVWHVLVMGVAMTVGIALVWSLHDEDEND